ncbi:MULTISPECIES: response regulator [Psychrobacter]|jgi:two-component system, NarL family, invasion response regulator UvrY|uniref:Response regulator n=1 Tax=Psychrobacter namhaensis TaxID=292734 RepID=A0ABW8L4Q9_9GAMM|nr:MULTISPECIES: response regulator [Psychrobacter]MCD1278514.1 response regulator [Psychrobacter sp. CCUG 69069]HCN18643.1 two-component system response regulator UvrY [Psychrobacter sp.]|tara:strand:- start:361 stop:996 length:636 start_codon:yes stop_codon:yes gene_type:complete
MIKVLVVDDHDLVRMGISRMLSDSADIEVVGEADSGDMAIKMAKQLRPDVILLDVNMPNIGGLEATKRLIQLDLGIKILAVSSMSAQPYPSMLIKAGVNGYITKGTPLDEMIRAVKKVYQGSRYFSQDVAEQLADVLLSDNASSPFDLLSDREKQVAMMVVNCQSPQQIADQLFVSVKTINTYRYRIYEKVGVDSDVKLTHLAIRHGLIQP